MAKWAIGPIQFLDRTDETSAHLWKWIWFFLIVFPQTIQKIATLIVLTCKLIVEIYYKWNSELFAIDIKLILILTCEYYWGYDGIEMLRILQHLWYWVTHSWSLRYMIHMDILCILFPWTWALYIYYVFGWWSKEEKWKAEGK